MCSIWQKEPKDLSFKVIDNLPDKIDKVNLSGGEPILNHQLLALVKEIKEKSFNPRFILLSNGLRPDLLLKKVSELEKITNKLGVAISLDGISSNLRGIKGAHKNQKISVLRVKKLGVSDLRISYLLTDNNYKELFSVYDFAMKQGIDFSWNIVRNSDFFYGNTNNRISEKVQKKVEKDIKKLISAQLSLPALRSWLRGYVSWGQLNNLVEKKRILPCLAGQEHFFINTQGFLYPCNWLDYKMGDLKKEPFEKIIKREGANVKKIVASCNKCWGCGLKSELSKNKFRVTNEVLSLKISNLFKNSF
jgi:MoaA/NifB/PqqE/SkfB family radical SAM enzyme